MSRRPSAVLVAVFLQVGAVGVTVGACSDPPTKPGPAIAGSTIGGGGGGSGGGGDGGDGGGTEGGLDGSTSEGGVCNDVPITGQLVDRNGVVGEPPVATGGTVVDGLYDLMDFSVYVGAGGVGGPTGITARASMRIAGGKLEDAIELGGSGKTVTTKTSSSAYTVAGATLAATELCPTTGGGKQLQFTANDPVLVLTDLTSKEAFTFTKR